jgi:Mg2+/Co2+ transporter CorC
MSDQLAKLSEMHDLVIDQVLEDLQNGDRRARQEAMALLKNSNVTAVAAEGSTLKKLAGKLDFSEMNDKVVPIQKAV